MESIWEIITAVSTATATAIILFAAIYTILQLHEAKKSRKMQAFGSILDRLGRVEEREARRYVILNFPKGETDLTRLSEDDRKKVESVMACFDQIGFFVTKGFIPIEYVSDLIGISIIRCWDKLNAYILKRRSDEEQATKFKSKYVGKFEELEKMVKECLNPLKS